MRKYVYEDAIVYITEPTEEQLENIRKATEKFARQLVKKGLMGNVERRDNHGVSRVGVDAGKRNQ
jgi:hypothetical protein